MGKIKDRKITGVYWTTSDITIGIVSTRNEVGEEKCYIGKCLGSDPEKDCIWISNRGASFPLKEGKLLIKKYGEPKNIII